MVCQSRAAAVSQIITRAKPLAAPRSDAMTAELAPPSRCRRWAFLRLKARQSRRCIVIASKIDLDVTVADEVGPAVV
jgi:hypothetical protein